MEHGVLCVMMDGDYLMLELSVDSWDFLEPIQPTLVLNLVKELDQSGWIMYDAGVMKADLINVITMELVVTTVAMMKMLV